MIRKRTIRARDIVNDIRARMTDSEIMTKYSLSAKGLESLFKKLIEAGALKGSELYGRFPGSEDTVNLGNVRSSPRNYLAFPLPIYETDNLQVLGTVRDLSERGLMVSGIESQVEENKEFLIQADEFQDIYPFVFKATCRWATNGCSKVEPVAGFEITEISEEALRQLRAILRVLSFSDGDERLTPFSDAAVAMTLRSTPANPCSDPQIGEIP